MNRSELARIWIETSIQRGKIISDLPWPSHFQKDRITEISKNPTSETLSWTTMNNRETKREECVRGEERRRKWEEDKGKWCAGCGGVGEVGEMGRPNRRFPQKCSLRPAAHTPTLPNVVLRFPMLFIRTHSLPPPHRTPPIPNGVKPNTPASDPSASCRHSSPYLKMEKNLGICLRWPNLGHSERGWDTRGQRHTTARRGITTRPHTIATAHVARYTTATRGDGEAWQH